MKNDIKDISDCHSLYMNTEFNFLFSSLKIDIKSYLLSNSYRDLIISYKNDYLD